MRETDIELLEIQAEMSFDARRRMTGLCGVTLARAHDGQILLVGSDLSDKVAAELAATFDATAPTPPRDPSVVPPALERCEELLGAANGPQRCRSGPSYVFRRDTAFASTADIRRSDATNEDVDTLQSGNPGNWDLQEWGDLLDGSLGPWAMALVDGNVVSVCHTPRPMTERAAECGVWTHPDARGRGHAAAVTAAWAAILLPTHPYLFYSTDRENRSSQRVAAHLDLRPIGWTWTLTPAT